MDEPEGQKKKRAEDKENNAFSPFHLRTVMYGFRRCRIFRHDTIYSNSQKAYVSFSSPEWLQNIFRINVSTVKPKCASELVTQKRRKEETRLHCLSVKSIQIQFKKLEAKFAD